MTIKSFLIGPYDSGLQNNVQPWLLPEDAFEKLEDAYVWRGRIRKRYGNRLIGTSDLNSRLRVDLGSTDGSGDISVTVPGAVFKVGQMFSCGSEIFTVVVTGTPAAMITTGAATVATYNTTTGALVLNGAALNTDVYFYPAEPVMGLRTRENANVNREDLVGFDTQFAYTRSGGAWERLGTAIWTGGNADFFWTTNYRGSSPFETFFYAVNYVRADRINYLPEGSSTWTQIRPQLDSTPLRYLDSCKVLIGFKDRLIALNTLETDDSNQRVFLNRARYSRNGDPTDPATSWLDDVPGEGGFLDAPVSQAIVTADIIRDRLVVYFERSTWELAYTGDRNFPFRWQQINNELGAEATFSVIGFDTQILGVGNVGVHACDGVNVSRIDEKIPDEVFKIHNGNEGPSRVYGIRDYYRETVLWTFPSQEDNPTFPTNILLYNYINRTWAFFNDSFTCFGYYQQTSDITWADLPIPWYTYPTPWNAGQLQSSFPDIVAGNQEGFVVIMDAALSSNGQTLYITNMTPASSTLTVIDHNLKQDDFVRVEMAQGITTLNSIIVKVDFVTDENNIIIDRAFSGTYTGGGKLTRVNGLNITTKQFNPGTPVGQQFRFPFIDLLLSTTDTGEVSIDTVPDARTGNGVWTTSPSGVLLGTNIVSTAPNDAGLGQYLQEYIWHRQYMQTAGQFLQFVISLSDAQNRDAEIAFSEFEMQAMIVYAEPQGRLIG